MTGSTSFSLEKIPDGSTGGTTQAETRIYNERLVLSLIRRHGQLSKADLTRFTGLAAQTITTLVNRATDKGLLIRRDPPRGRLGQPAIPYALNPEGAYAFGLNIDFRGAEVALVNFTGQIIARERTAFAYPTPREVVRFARSAVGRITRRRRALAAGRVAGLGIASPFYHSDATHDGSAQLGEWKRVDIRAELDSVFDWPVYLFNDGTVSAGAELMFGAGLGRADFFYVYVGDFVVGGVVLDRHLFPGRNKLAGAIGNMPVPIGSKGGTAALSDRASLNALASRNSGNGDIVWSPGDDWSGLRNDLDEWIEEAANGLAHVAASAVALIDVDCIVVDGAMPAAVRRQITRELRRKLAERFLHRPESFTVTEGSFGILAPAIGGASIPLLAKYSNDKETLFKDDRELTRRG